MDDKTKAKKFSVHFSKQHNVVIIGLWNINNEFLGDIFIDIYSFRDLVTMLNTFFTTEKDLFSDTIAPVDRGDAPPVNPPEGLKQ